MSDMAHTVTVEAAEAARILRNLAERYRDQLGDLSEMEWDDLQLAKSSGDMEAIEALEMGARMLDSVSATQRDGA